MPRTFGRSEWIAQSHEEYATIVRDLARNVELRKQLRATQREHMASSELADAKGRAKAVQDSFAGIDDAWLAKR